MILIKFCIFIYVLFLSYGLLFIILNVAFKASFARVKEISKFGGSIFINVLNKVRWDGLFISEIRMDVTFNYY